VKLAIMQPYFFPYIGAYQLIYEVDKYIIYGLVNYKNDGWFHKNRLIEVNRGPFYFYVQMIDSSIHKKFYEIKINPDKKWRNKLIKTIEHNYRNSFYYEETVYLINNIIFSDYNDLLHFNANSIIQICKHLDINTEILICKNEYEDLEQNLDIQYGNKINSSNCRSYDIERKTARIIKICQREGASAYINPIGGQSLYSEKIFKEYGIELHFLKTRGIKYNQKWNNFEPNMSILDVLMNCGKEKTKDFLKEYDIV
jgi:hypothetical protein